MATYELWLTDDAGKRKTVLKDLAFFAYTRATNGLGTINLGMPFQPFKSQFNPYFQPDWRVEVWRSPAYGIPMRREDVFLLRKPNVYVRQEDNVQILQFYGRNGIDLLKRRSVIQKAGSAYATKTDFADDMMKEIVSQQMLYGSALDETGAADNTRAWPQNEFTVQADAGQGPSVTRSFAGKTVYDVLKDLKEATFQLNLSSSTNSRIFFDVVPMNTSSNSTASGTTLGWEFRTYADLYGADRTLGRQFSLENENIKAPTYSLSHLDEVTKVWVNGNGAGDSQIITSVTDADRAAASRWNVVEKIISASNEAETTGLQNAGYAELYNGRPLEELPVTFLNTPGSRSVPQSLYGIDWDLGDLLPVNYAGKQFNVEVLTIYVAVDQDGRETITGRNEVNSG